MAHPRTRIDFESCWPLIEGVPGWLTADQAYELFRLTRSVRGTSGAPGIRVVEIGSHQGRSTLALALAGKDVELTAVDPFVGGRMFGGPDVRRLMVANLKRAGVTDRVTLLTMTSRRAFSSWPAGRVVDLVHIDGKHDVVSLLLDLRWARFVHEGGHVAVHDMFSSIGVTLGALLALPFARRLTFAHRVGSLAVLETRRPRPTERLRALAHLPWFARNVVVKICLRLRLLGAARAMGHTDVCDPY